jgi:hypothetical protein
VGAAMLVGLQSLRYALNYNNPQKKEKQPVEHPAEIQKDSFTPNAVFDGFYKDHYGIIHTPSGKMLFTASNRIDVTFEGVILEEGEPIGRIDLFDSPVIPFTAEQRFSMDINSFVVQSIINLRSFEANIRFLSDYGELIGAVINMKS